MRRYYHYKKRPRPFPVEILSAMREDSNSTPSPVQWKSLDIKFEASSYNLISNHLASFEKLGSSLVKAIQGLYKRFDINNRKSGI